MLKTAYLIAYKGLHPMFSRGVRLVQVLLPGLLFVFMFNLSRETRGTMSG